MAAQILPEEIIHRTITPIEYKVHPDILAHYWKIKGHLIDKYEYMATASEISFESDARGYRTVYSDQNVVLPKEEGWELISSAATNGVIVWTWRRLKE